MLEQVETHPGTISPLARPADGTANGHATGPVAALRWALLGSLPEPRELPALPDVVAGVIALAAGNRARVILPLGGTPAEFALTRRGDRVLVDCYGAERLPEIFVRRREIGLRQLRDACIEATCASAAQASDATTRDAIACLADRLARAPIAPDPYAGTRPVRCTGGSLRSPGDDVALAFGFDAAIEPSLDGSAESHAFADVHALLFDGKLWAFSRGRRFELFEGPIMLAAQSMVSAVRALTDAWQADRPVNVRLTGGGLPIAVRLARGGEVSWTFGGPGAVTLPALDVPSAALPMLRLASDLARKLNQIDRCQVHNLRLAELKREIRALRRTIRLRDRVHSFENADPDRLRLSTPEPIAPAPGSADAPGALRYVERWRAELDGVDAATVFARKDRVIAATNKLTLALDRSDGRVLWSRPTAGAASLLLGGVLLRALPDGELELCEVDGGEAFARTRLSSRTSGPLVGTFAGGGNLPPMAILSEGPQRLVAIDLRTGQPRWEFRARAPGALHARRAGRVLLVTSGEASIDALDIATGEVVWRFSDRARFALPPTVAGEVVVAAAGTPGGGRGALHGIGLYTGRPLWRTELPAAPSAEPIGAGKLAVIAYGRSRRARLIGVDAATGARRWRSPDPGLDNGGAAIRIDDALCVNTPSGRASLVDLSSGQARWSRALANPLTDDVPRQLMPILAGGALYVPSAQVHTLHPQSGEPLCEIGCDLVPDFLHVDARGCVIAEESGHLRAFAPLPVLRLVK